MPLVIPTMTTSQPKQKSSLGCVGLLFGCGIRSKVSDDENIAPSKSSPTEDGKIPTTVESNGKHSKANAAEQQQLPPSPDKTEASEDASVLSEDDEMPDVDDLATHTGSANPATGNSGTIFRGMSAMEKNIMRILFSYLFALLTLGLADRSTGSSKKAITDGSSESKKVKFSTADPDACSTEKKED